MKCLRVRTRPVTRGGAGGASSPRNFFASLEKCVGHSLKLLDTVQKIWAPLRKLLSPPVSQAGYGPGPH